MAIVCPTVTAYDTKEYRRQVDRISGFAKRIHIDLMDGTFAPTKSPNLDQIWWPHEIRADVHLMYQHPGEYVKQLIKLKPNMVIVHNEADVHHMDFSARLHSEGIKVGLAILRNTPVEYAYQIMHAFDHVLIFSGSLGYHGGEADMKLLDKVKKVRSHHPEAEIGWDGGINDKNAEQLVEAGVDVLNTGGFIQKSDNPNTAFNQINQVIVNG